MEEHKKSFLTIMEFAEELKVHPNTVRRAIKKGRIGAIKTGNGKRSFYRIPRSEFQRMAMVDMEDVIERMIEKRMGK